MYQIRRFNIVKTATVAALMYMVIVAIFVVPFVVFALLITVTGSAQAQQFFLGSVIFGLFAIFGYAILGWVFTAIACYIYNIVAAWVGGIEVQVEPVAPPPPLPGWMTPPSAPPGSPGT